tara:strand:- start:8881 stop:10611 length:1731 start_codon:yes stop_codon:yes gene_type:complete
MSITFKKIRYKNFLGAGDQWTEVELNKFSTTLVIGANGSGKSVLTDAIAYALYGKPYRNIRKPQLINSINRKNMVVEIEFSVGNDEYFIKRGMYPGFFEIYKNNKMFDQTARRLDYQKMLEQDILKLNQRAFNQIVILGSANFVPFMQLSAGARREVIEELLDIRIFSSMRMLVKKQIGERKLVAKDIQTNIESLNAQISIQNGHVKDIEALLKTNQDEYIVEKDACISKIMLLKAKREELLKSDLNQSLLSNSIKKKNDTLHQNVSIKGKIENNVARIAKNLTFFKENDSCPMCLQAMELTHRTDKIATAEGRITKLTEGKNELAAIIAKNKTVVEGLENELKTQRAKIQEIRSLDHLIQTEETRQATVEAKINVGQKKTDITGVKETINDLYDQRNARADEKDSERVQLTYDEAILEMFKDSGIKTKVIRQYVPIMNKLVNEYLEILDFFVLFTLDENFNETIRSRHRDTFSYHSFSEGEKSRIDLALMFCWRELARLKNSAHTNLLILDETLDQSLDAEGIDKLMNIIHQFAKNCNIVVISHRAVNRNSFDRILCAEKVNNFSVLNHNDDDGI